MDFLPSGGFVSLGWMKPGSMWLEMSMRIHVMDKENIFITGTFGKAVGTFGAFFSGKKDHVEFVLQKARSYIYSTSLPVNAVEATRKSLKIISKEKSEIGQDKSEEVNVDPKTSTTDFDDLASQLA